MGTHLPFFTVWLKAVGIDRRGSASFRGPGADAVHGASVRDRAAERRYSLRGALTVTALATALGFALIGTQYLPLAVILVAGISGLIQPNSRVDVLVTIKSDASDKQVAKLFMENMRVLSVGTDIQRDREGKSTNATTVTLGVTPEEAERLAIAMNTGSIQLVLRGYGDPDSVRTEGATSVDVLRRSRREANAKVGRREACASSPGRCCAARATPVVAAVPKPPPPVDSIVVNVYRAGKAMPQKFDWCGRTEVRP